MVEEGSRENAYYTLEEQVSRNIMTTLGDLFGHLKGLVRESTDQTRLMD